MLSGQVLGHMSCQAFKHNRQEVMVRKSSENLSNSAHSEGEYATFLPAYNWSINNDQVVLWLQDRESLVSRLSDRLMTLMSQ